METEKSLGETMLARLTAFRDALADGKDIHQLFTIREIEIPEPKHYGGRDVARLRSRLRVSQGVIAKMLGVSAVLVRQWEGGLRSPSGSSARLLEILEKHPEHFIQVIRQQAKRPRSKLPAKSKV